MLLIALGLILAYGAGCAYLAHKYLHPDADPLGPIPTGLRAETWSLPSGPVDVWVSSVFASVPVFVLNHGYRGSQSYWSSVAEGLIARGISVVIPTMPGHHDPHDLTTGFGVKEARRVREVVDHLLASGVSQVVLVGVSMGAAASWRAAVSGPGVVAVVSDGCFTRFNLAMDRWFDLVMPLGRVWLRPVQWIATLRTGVRPSDVVPIADAATWRRRPALIIQGDADRLIPVEQAQELAEASGGELWIIPGARHAACLDVAGSEYVERLVRVAK